MALIVTMTSHDHSSKCITSDIYGIRARTLLARCGRDAAIPKHCKTYGDAAKVWLDENLREAKCDKMVNKATQEPWTGYRMSDVSAI